MMVTAFQIGRLLALKSYDFILNVGIAGSFSEALKLGEVVNVTCEQFGDLGAEDKSGFLSVFELGLMKSGGFPFKGQALESPNGANQPFPLLDSLPKVSGISVNKVHGNMDSIEMVKEKFKPEVETMEGIACAYACKIDELPFCQVRAISNRVEPRNKSSWDIKLAIANLNNFLIELFNHPDEN